MANPIKTPEELLAYRPLKDLLAAKPKIVHAAQVADSVISALQLMAQHSIGFLVVLDGSRLAGVLSERDYARKVVLQSKSSKDTLVREIMTDQVVTVTLQHTIPQCMALMHSHSFRHLPVMEGNAVIGVLSIRDLLKATIEHHERLIRDLETERMTILNPNVSSY
jgi:signal-transduction protein with cAMP-binding, CBS, and nucleotidyltransferase domain